MGLNAGVGKPSVVRLAHGLYLLHPGIAAST